MIFWQWTVWHGEGTPCEDCSIRDNQVKTMGQ